MSKASRGPMARRLQAREAAKATLAKVYADVNSKKTSDWWDYEHFSPDWTLERQERYELLKKVGRGKYSEVFEALDNAQERRVVIKVLKPVRMRKIRREIKILQNLAGGPNVVKLFGIVREPECHTPALIFERIDSDQIREILKNVTDYDARFYLVEILRGLDYCHSMGIMHRDIKPQNLVIDHKNHTLRIIDWGLAEFYHPRQDYNSRVGSRHYKSPELLVEYPYYDYSLDIWSVGCMMASMIFQEDIFFRGANNHDQLVKIAKVLGTDKLNDYLDRYNIQLDPKLKRDVGTQRQRPWADFATRANKGLATSEAVDLVSRMLQYDHAERPSAKECLEHPYLQATFLRSQETQSSTDSPPVYTTN